MVAQNLILLRSLSDLMSYRSRDLHNKILSISHIFSFFFMTGYFIKIRSLFLLKLRAKHLLTWE